MLFRSAPITQVRYFNVAAITTEGRTISTQVLTDNVDEAKAVLRKWYIKQPGKSFGEPADEIVSAVIYDTGLGTTQKFATSGCEII